MWHRNVPWSQAKQLRTVLETELSADDIFDYLHFDLGSAMCSKQITKEHSRSERLKDATSGSEVNPFTVKKRDTATALLYKMVPLPWYVSMQCFGDDILASNLVHTILPYHRPLTDRDIFIVQDYVRVTSDNDGSHLDETWFFTYNYDVDHHYFAPRVGFVRGKMKYQGMVGFLGDGGKTRLTWLVDFDFRGTLPTSFMNAVLVNLMIYPVSVAEKTREYLQEKKSKVAAATSSAVVEDLTSAVELELPDLKAKLAEMKAMIESKDDELRRKDDELRRKDDELRRKDVELKCKDEEMTKQEAELKCTILAKDDELEDKDKEIMELRRRLPRKVEEEEL